MCKGKFNIRKFFAALMPGPKTMKKDIHAQLAETIAERKKILGQWEMLFHPKQPAIKKDIHNQLQETIAELVRNRQQWGRPVTTGNKNVFVTGTNKAA